MGACTHSVNAVRIAPTNPDDIRFEVLYSEEVNFLANQGSGY